MRGQSTFIEWSRLGFVIYYSQSDAWMSFVAGHVWLFDVLTDVSIVFAVLAKSVKVSHRLLDSLEVESVSWKPFVCLII